MLAERAIYIAERLKDKTLLGVPISSEDERISGREAYYFSAVAKRLCAQNLSELEGVAGLLDKADLAFAHDRTRQDPPAVDDLRFQCERCALRLTKQLFLRFANTDEKKKQNDQELKVLLYEFRNIADKSARIGDVWVKDNVERHALINYFMIMAICDFDETGAQDVDLEAQVLANRLQDNITRQIRSTDIGIPETFLVAAVRIFSTARYLSMDRAKLRKLREEFEALEYEFRAGRARHVMPYDRRRFEYLLGRTKRAVGQQIPN